MSANSVLVVGAQGVLGRLCAEALRDAGLNVVRGGRRPEDAADFRLIDLDEPGSVAAACADVDLVVSTVRHPAHPVERQVLAGGGALLDIATFTLAERVELRAAAVDARGLVVLDAGLAPGVSSLVLKELLAEHPDVDGVEGAATFSALEPSGRAVAVDFLVPTFRSARRHATKVIDFPDPIGRRRCMRLTGADAEAMIFGGLADDRSRRAYGVMIERPVQAEFLALNALGLLSRMPLGFFTAGSRWKAGRTTAKPQSHVMTVMRGDQRLAARAVEGSGNYVMTAAAVVGFAEALLARRAAGSAPTGVLGVEDVFDLSEIRAACEQCGIRIVPAAAG